MLEMSPEGEIGVRWLSVEDAQRGRNQEVQMGRSLMSMI